MRDSWLEENLKVLSQRQPQEAEILAAIPFMAKEDTFTVPLVGAAPVEARANASRASDLRANDARSDNLKAIDSEPAVILSQGQNGTPVLALDLGQGPKRLTSSFDPQKEDALLTTEFLKSRPLNKGLTVIGFGLGYHLEILIEKLGPEEPLWLWEGRPELAVAAFLARDFRSILRDKRFSLRLGDSLPPKAPKTILARPANLRLDRELYPEKNPSQALKQPRILFLGADYYLGQEIPRAARSLKAPLQAWAIDPRKTEENFRNLFQEMKLFRPEMVLTINHLGLDADGIVADIFQRLGVPIASWFVDSPVYVLRPGPQSDVFIFSWDADYVEWLKLQGLNKAEFLPLATDPETFAPRESLITRQIAFVGDSLTAATNKYLALSGLGPDSLDRVDQLAKNFLKNADLTPNRLTEVMAEREGLNQEQTRALWGLVTWRASRLYRLKVLKGLEAPEEVERLTIRGDEGWADLGLAAQLGGSVDYYKDLADFYRSSAINLNITSAQMKTGLNQRVFDAPGAGGFLLTDAKKQLNALFAPDEIVTYQSPLEAKSLARFYLSRPKERERIIKKAQRRIFGEHLYAHRLEKIIKKVLARP
ncbi:MAG: glycosyltransferase [Deltaproteobacteria bacterium]|jgi:hypothetical protein|nr:glycosyltransferase [Deltaproteobacteria bacterium]